MKEQPFKLRIEGEASGMAELQVDLSFTVSPASNPLSATVVNPPPAMQVGVALNAVPVAQVQGGVPPYSYGLDASSQQPPPGVTLAGDPNSGAITATGEPTSAGTFSGIVLDVTDSSGSSTKVKIGKK